MKLTVLPSSAAAAVALSRLVRRKGAMAGRQVMTLDGLVMGLAQWAVEEGGRELVEELAGAVIVRELAEQRGEEVGSWGEARSTWRMLVELRAGGASAELIESLGSSGARALAAVFREYEQVLADRGLEDHGGGCRKIEQLLARGKRPQWLEGVEVVRVEGVVWLRAMDIVVLRALGEVVEVEVVFAPQPRPGALGPYEELFMAACQGLGPRVRVSRPSLAAAGALGPVADRAAVGLKGPGVQGLKLVQAGGLYAQAERMVEYVLEALGQGWEEDDVLVCLPSLDLHAQMIADAARRRSVPLSVEEQGLEHTAVVQSVLDLARLVVEDWGVRILERIFTSPYIRPGLERLAGVQLPKDVPLKLARSGYVREAGIRPAQWFAQSMEPELARACESLQELVEPLAQHQHPGAYARQLRSLMAGLGIRQQILRMGGGLAGRELVGLEAVERALSVMEEASSQLHPGALSPRLLLGLLRESLARQGGKAGGRGGGVRVVSLANAVGLQPKVLVVGGLNQREFPRIPPPVGLLSAREQRDVNRRLGMVIWRTPPQEFAGQMARALALVGAAEKALVIFPAADAQGQSLAPAGLFLQLARAGGEQVEQGGEGVYGLVPSLNRVRHMGQLWAGAARELLRPGGRHCGLAQAIVWQLCQNDQGRRRWQAIASRVLVPGVRGGIKESEARQWWKGLMEARATKALTPTELEKLKGCPFMWVLESLLRLEGWPREGWDLGAREEGNLVHRVMAELFDPQRPLSALQQPQTIAQLLAQAAAELVSGGVHPLVLNRRLKRLKQWLEATVKAELEQMSSRGSTVLGVEQEVQLELEEAGVVIRGRLDRLEQAGEELIITDYKHSYPNRLPEINPHKWEEKGQFQLWVYAAAVARHLPGKSVRLRYVCTRAPSLPPRETPALSRDDKLLGEDLARAVMELWEEVVDGAIPARESSELCRRCSFRSWCEEARR